MAKVFSKKQFENVVFVRFILGIGLRCFLEPMAEKSPCRWRTDKKIDNDAAFTALCADFTAKDKYLIEANIQKLLVKQGERAS